MPDLAAPVPAPAPAVPSDEDPERRPDEPPAEPVHDVAAVTWHERLLPAAHRVPVVTTFLVSLLLCVGFLLLPLAGTDLSAQVARGHFFREHGFVPVDFRWFGGVYPFGYSAFTGPLNAVFGSRGVGVLSCVVSAVAFAWLLARVGAPRPTLGGALGALVGVFNLVSGRTTFAMGIAFGMVALCVVALDRPATRRRAVTAGALAMCATAASPVAGLFAGVCGVALLLSRRRGGLPLAIGAGVGMVVPALLFRDGGVQPFTEAAAKVSVAACVAVFFLVPGAHRAVRIGALLTAVGTIATFYLPNPLGSNVVRLPTLFAAPVVVAIARLDRRLLVGAVVALCWWQPPLVAGDLGSAGTREAGRLYFQPLIDQLGRRGPVGRVEVVPLRDHWESTYVADAVPIARGWERQVDVDRNALFYDGTLTTATYLSWLYDNAVGWVAAPKDVRLDAGGREESALIEAGLPYLAKAWENGDWTLYRVVGGPPLVQFPGELIRSGPTGVAFRSPVATDLTVRVRWSPWLVLEGPDGCVRRNGAWVTVRLRRGGEYRLTGSFAAPFRGNC